MSTSPDPTDAIRRQAVTFPGVAKGTSCTQSSFKARKDPDRFEVGSTGWVTVRFTAEKPLPKKIWGKWLSESNEVTCGQGRI